MFNQKSSEQSEEKQRHHIRKCLHLLIQWTRICPMTVAILSKHGVLGAGDESALKSIQNEHEKNKEFYSIIQFREGFFEILKEAMKETRQTGVLKLLSDFNINEGSYTPRKYSSVPCDLKKFLDLKSSDNDKTLSIVTSVDTKITIEKVRETFGNVCGIFECLGKFRDEISRQASNNRCLLVPVISFEELKDVINDTFNNTPGSRHLLVMIVTTHENCKLVQNHIKGNRSWSNNVKLMEDKMEWDDLSPAHKQHIRSKLLTLFANYQENLDKLVHGPVLAQLINDEAFKPFKETIPEPLKYYIDRKVITRNIISPDIFQIQTSNTFVFTGMSRSELSKFMKNGKMLTGSSREQLSLDTVNVKFMIEDKPGHFERLCNKIRKQSHSPSESVHLIHRDSTKILRWIKSVGQMDRIQKCIDPAQDTLSEEDFIKLSKDSNFPVCVADSPGMGKSVLLGNIARKLAETSPDRSIFFVSIVHLINKLGKNNSGAVANALEDIVCECDMAKEVLKLKLSSSTKVSIELFLDGFDELETSNYQFALGVIQTIVSSFKAVRLWVTSRQHFIDELENTLNTLGYKIQPFRDEDQIQFLTKYWRRDEMDADKINQFARTCLDTIKSSYSQTGRDIAGIPLQCRLIGEVYEHQAMEYGVQGKPTCLEDTFEVTSITNLFEQTIHNRFKKYQDMNQEKKLTREALMQIHAGLSLEFLFPVSFKKKLKILFSNHSHVEDILKVGILEASSTSASSEAPRFVHRTFAEYFAAWFLVSKLKGEGALWQRYFLKSYSAVTNLMVTGKPSICHALTEFLFEEVLNSKEETVGDDIGSFFKAAYKINSYKFANTVITYFLNFLLANPNLQIISTRFTCYFIRPDFFPDRLRRLTQSCVNADLLQTFNFFSALNLFYHPAVARTVFDHDLLFLAVRHSSLKFVQKVLTQFEEHHTFDVPSQTTVLYLAVERGDFSILELFLNEKHLDVLVGSAKLLLHTCIAFSKNDSEDMITQRIEICKSLLHESRSLLEEKDESKRTPLLRPDVHVKLLITLVELGADVTATDPAGDTLIHLNFNGGRQFSNEDYESVLSCIPEKMLKRLVYVKATDGDVPPVRILKQIDPSEEIIAIFKMAGFNFNYIAEDNYSFLATAIKTGRRADTLNTLISFGCDIHWKKKHRTLLHIAVKYGNADAVTVLLERTTNALDVTCEDRNGLTPLDYAVQRSKYYNRLETGKLLWKYGGKYIEYDDNEKMWLHLAAEKADCEAVKLLLHFGKSPNCKHSYGNTPLHFAVKEYENKQNSVYEITKLLLDNEANPNLVNDQEETPFYSALRNTNLDIDTYNLLKSKTDLSWTQDVATQALKFAIRAADSLEINDFFTLVQECVRNGGDVNCKYNGDTALHCAVNMQDKGVVKLLVQHGADSNLRNALNQTPFHRAALCNDKDFGYEIMQFFIENGADESENRTILQIVERGDIKSSQIQLDAVANTSVKGNSSFDRKYSIGINGNLPVQNEDITISLLVSSNQTPTSSFEQSSKNREIMVGQDCSIPNVVRVLHEVPSTLSNKWSAIGRDLGIPHSEIKTLRQDLVLHQITLNELMFELIEMWVAMQGKAATLKQLIYVLRKNGMAEAAGTLRTSFLQPDSNVDESSQMPR